MAAYIYIYILILQNFLNLITSKLWEHLRFCPTCIGEESQAGGGGGGGRGATTGVTLILLDLPCKKLCLQHII